MTAGGALIVGEGYAGLEVARSLGRHGVPVWVLARERKLAALSRYTRRTILWPDADEAEQRDRLLDLAARWGLQGWAIFATDDFGVELLARHHEALSPHFTLTIPPWPDVQWAADKRQTYALAERLGVPVPWTRYPANREEVAALDPPFPVVLKPAIKEADNAFTHDRAWRADTMSQLLAGYDRAACLAGPQAVMIQELLPLGATWRYSYAALSRDGEPLLWMAVRHLRQYPLDFSHHSTLIESVELPEVEAQGRALLAATGFTGLIQIQFHHDPHSGRYRILDANPRPWGSHGIGRRAGTDFPYAQWRMLTGETILAGRAQTGVRWVRILSDLRAARELHAAGRLSWRDYLQSLRPPIREALFAPDDPLPGMLELPLVLWRRRPHTLRPATTRSGGGTQARGEMGA